MKRPVFVALSILILIGIGGCGKKESAPTDEKPAETSSNEESAKAVTLSPETIKESGIEIVTAQMMALQPELKVAGTVASISKGRALVTPPVAGRIISLFVSPGETVRQGQTLAVLESSELALAFSAIAEAERGRQTAEAEKRKADSELLLSKSHLQAAQGQLARQRSLAKAGAFSQPSLQAAQKEVTEVQADLDSVIQDQAVHKSQLERAERLYKQELISRTDVEQARLLVAQDQVHRQRAEARLEEVQKTLAREKDIAQKGLLTAKEVQTAESEVRSANFEVARANISAQAAGASLTSAHKALANAQTAYAAVRGRGNRGSGSSVTLVAPLSGTVTERKATVGQAVERTAEIFEIENLETVWVTTNVPEKNISSVRKGATVRIVTQAFPSKMFTGVVQSLGNHLDAKTRTMPVQCVVQNREGLLREDMFATVLLGIGGAKSTLVVPDGSIDKHGDETSVFVFDGKAFSRRSVEIGSASGGYTEVRSGLKSGEKVVSAGLFVIESEFRKDELKGEE